MAANKKAQQLARQLFKLSLVDGRVSAERVTGVLGYIEKLRPAHPLTVLKAYHRFVATELAKSQAVVEHAGAVSDSVLQTIAASMTKKYGRAITASTRANPKLLAGLRVRVGDDVYESSVSGQLGALAASV
ncbi:MAG: F0F1 ATP synthase subunit delta [Verrucomicrobia bacterium]|nr:F0F1 ATP synthase subunit delta [Verrucomicrobiota bacterium]